ncbi:MAG TPA: hypothetical protein VM869_14875 [Enhygromyxa sp.]|nr:hypothetical protein [Enhygromyxa sp.]
MTKALKRVVLVGAGLAALVAGLLVGTTACMCDLDPIENGVYEIVASPDRVELVGAIVEVGEDTVEISFTDADGNDWRVRYAITSRDW